MTEQQLSFFDAPAAQDFQRKQKEAEMKEWLISVLGPKKAQKRYDEDARLQARLDEIYSHPLPPYYQDALAEIQAKVLARTKPLNDKYALLGVAQNASKRDIKNAYRRQARKLHPDIGGDSVAFKRMYEAYRHILALAKE